MTLGTGIVISGFAYACACRVSKDVSERGIERGRTMGLSCLAFGITVDMFLTFVGG